jgi:hypothetical protein
MKLTRRQALFCRWMLIFAFLIIAPASDPQAAAQEDQHVLTFVQITDAHLFDDTEDSGADNRKAIDWASRTVADMQQSGLHIDFIVYTGDFGLENVASKGTTDCDADASKAQHVKPYCFSSAVTEAASRLSKFRAARIFLVPGNNDLDLDSSSNETISGINHYLKFVSALREEMKHGPDQVRQLEFGAPISIKGVRLVGFESETLKSTDAYEMQCNQANVPSSLAPHCPLAQVEKFDKEVEAGLPILVFTHIPYLVDPYRCEAWKLQQNGLDDWARHAGERNVIGVFSGHFHSADQSIYGSNTGVASLTPVKGEAVARKSWVAPPLAVKHQTTYRPQARGFLLASVDLKTMGVQVEPYWFVTDILPPGGAVASTAPSSTCKRNQH